VIGSGGPDTKTSSGAVRGAALLPRADCGLDYLPHAEIAWRDGRICELRALPGPPPREALLWLPGLVDLHVHWPQAHVRGQFAGQLLPWLRESIWPAEAEFAAADRADEAVAAYLLASQRAGTCAALVFGAPFAVASRRFRALAPPGWVEGPALMEVNAQAELLRPVAETLTALQSEPSGTLAAVSPRFAPNVTAAGLAHCAAVAAARGWPIQSHLSENLDEVAWVRALFPDARDYADVYDQAGLLGPRTVLAHGVHLSDRELARLAATSTTVAHCPTSNLALGSGTMPLQRLRDHGVPWVLATDVGAGPQLGLLDVVRACLRVHPARSVGAAEALCRATAVPGAWLAQFDDRLAGLGTLARGAPAHLVGMPLTQGADPEAVVRNLLAALPAKAECAPTAVVTWGQRLPLPPA